jgi:cytochrome b pre-mRNA-processing protein 3
MTLFSALWKPRSAEQAAARLYAAIVGQARRAAFYVDHEVPDTVDGRFDLIVLHVMLVMRRLRREGAEGQHAAQELFDYMFKDMDRSLREMGVGDMGIGKHIKKMAKAFYGRAHTCEVALDSTAGGLESALMATLYRARAPADGVAERVARYLRAADTALTVSPADDVRGGQMAWPAP